MRRKEPLACVGAIGGRRGTRAGERRFASRRYGVEKGPASSISRNIMEKNVVPQVNKRRKERPRLRRGRRPRKYRENNVGGGGVKKGKLHRRGECTERILISQATKIVRKWQR